MDSSLCALRSTHHSSESSATGQLGISALGSLQHGSGPVWHLASQITDKTHSSVGIRRATYNVIVRRNIYYVSKIHVTEQKHITDN